ncbi:MAG: hypothetical protein ACLFOY_16610 [Desulfatibacillaceae bacterium]
MHRNLLRGTLVFLVLALVLGMALPGCSTLGGKDKKGTSASSERDQGPQPVYYDFGDVLVPHELEVDQDESFIYSTAGFSAGVLVLSGRVELSSLVRFFENNMLKDNWVLVSSFKSPRTIMLFRKDNRWAVVNITEGKIRTEVEIWVAPTAVQDSGAGISESGLMK